MFFYSSTLLCPYATETTICIILFVITDVLCYCPITLHDCSDVSVTMNPASHPIPDKLTQDKLLGVLWVITMVAALPV